MHAGTRSRAPAPMSCCNTLFCLEPRGGSQFARSGPQSLQWQQVHDQATPPDTRQTRSSSGRESQRGCMCVLPKQSLERRRSRNADQCRNSRNTKEAESPSHPPAQACGRGQLAATRCSVAEALEQVGVCWTIVASLPEMHRRRVWFSGTVTCGGAGGDARFHCVG